MRDIKFRVILEKENTPRECWGINLADLTALVYISGSREWRKYKTLLQYTGLKDKNGKEIREGDIVKTLAVLDDNKEFNCLVKWSAGGFIANGAICINHHLMEVIGNVYENPELLSSNQS